MEHVRAETIAEQVAYTQNGRSVTYREVTTQDLIVGAIRYSSANARAELSRRGIYWTAYLSDK